MNKRWILRNDTIKNLCVSWLSAIELSDDHLLEVVVKPYKKNRSLEQNDMFHAWCGSIAEKTGHTKTEIKDIIVEQTFGTREYMNLSGELRSQLRQTSSLNVGEMSELIERATQLGIELGADVPEVTHG
tara:strand:+ start:940 stop:1326 length:387 start_codon:yes stop_codon:yes gene_type:complete